MALFSIAFVVSIFPSWANPQGIVSGAGREAVPRHIDPSVDEGVQSAGNESPSETGPIDVRRMLRAHNEWRLEAGVPPLSWSPKLARHAQEWAEFLCREGRFEHRPNSPYGENLATATGGRLTSDQVVALWGHERTSYDREANSCAPGSVCGHFTQLVWKSTREVGCGVARRGTREVWVCNYNPPGNIIGRTAY